MKKLQSLLYPAGILILFISFVFASLHLVRGDVLFHTDLARDVLIVEEIVETRRPDLIGPRAGGIPGLFFGPIWYYMMITFFLIGSGSPVAIGVFWLLMVVLAVLSAGTVASKIFGREVGLLTAVLYSAFLVPAAFGFTQSFASLILSPVIFFLIFRFRKTTEKKYLIALALLLGFLFHFQPAFAMLIGAISFLFTGYILKKANKLNYIFFFLLGIIPLANFIIFDLRHDFLQIRSLFSFLTDPPQERVGIRFIETIINRLDGFFQRLNLIPGNKYLAYFLSILLNGFIFIKALRNKKLKERSFYLIFFGFYVSFWVLSFIFKGQVWDFYHWGFLPLVVMIFASLYKLIPRKLFLIIYLIVLIPVFVNGAQNALARGETFSKTSSSSWILNKTVADYIYQNAEDPEFGYFVYSTDRFGFGVKYAINYLDQFYDQESKLCSKSAETFLIHYPTPDIGAVTDPVYWKKERIKIDRDPVSVKTFGEGVVVEKYLLDDEEIGIPHDSTLICDLSAR